MAVKRTRLRLLAAHIVLFASSTVAFASPAEAPYEATIQYALEKLTSGTPATSVVTGAEITVMPIRTWKSVSGHYCRRYEITVTEPGSDPVHGERTRCRVMGGWWMLAED